MLLLHAAAAAAQAEVGSDAPAQLTAAQLFRFAEQAEAQGDKATAETAYRALTADPDPDLRSEARFRLGMLLSEQPARLAEAAALFRAILADKPGAARVRLELSRVEVAMGDRAAAARNLRIAERAGLPDDVARMVRFFGNALSAAKPMGANLEASVAGDSNINRATRANTLGTVIGDFVLNEDARARAGLGVSLQGQAYLRGGIDRYGEVLASASVSADLHPGQSAFNDVALSLKAGPVVRPGRDRISLTAGPVWRWYGGTIYSTTFAVGAEWQHAAGRRAQVRFGGGVALVNNRRNDLQDGLTSSLMLGLDRQVGRRGGMGVQVNASRTLARDRGYSDVTAGGSVFVFREMGRLSAVASLGYSRLEADARLFLYPLRRRDTHWEGTMSLTWRQRPLARLAPFVRLRAERNRSTVGIYAFSRLAGEIGISAAF